MRRLILVLAAIATLPMQSRAQRSEIAQRGPRSSSAGDRGPRTPAEDCGCGDAPQIPRIRWGRNVPRWSAPIGSLLVPGLGQLRLGQDRFVAYAGAELFVWTMYVKELRELHRQRQAYKGLARNVARFFFSRNGPDGDWDYYEAMGKEFLESGAYSTVAGSEVVPETDPGTFNGHIWQIALRTYWGNPDVPPPVGSPAYQRALELYKRRAVPENLRWSWRNSQLERDLYRRAIARANDSFRRATVGGSLIVANHLLSAVDAFVVVRLEAVRSAQGEERVGASVRIPLP